jgi:hypothetical protein
MASRHCNVAKVHVVGDKSVILPVSGSDKPDISPMVFAKWPTWRPRPSASRQG